MKMLLLLIGICLLNTNYCLSQISCNNWLQLSNSPDGVTIGDLDVTGNKLTVEAVFNRTAPYTGGPSYAGDIVSKHLDPTDCNYLLRPGHAEITTTNGFFATPENCDIVLNKTYHAAMVYDGVTLKFYRNGFLMGQVNATGNLVTNDWSTKIGETASPRNTFATELKGFINEVRIWNVARTQQQIQANMNSSLSNPAAQSGLLGYYAFNNLLNKQGNNLWNGTITGNAAINSTNTSCNLVADSCLVIPSQSCNNWLNIPDQSSFFRIGDLDVPGDKITVEATFNRTTQWNGQDLFQGDLVAKHSGPNDCNYLLRPGSAEITTSKGYFKTPPICEIELNKTYHVAMVYDGINLKFYRNGFLMSEINAAGNLFQNDFLTQVGLYYSQITQESFIGYINEVRIWNVARTQQQIQATMNTSLSNPAVQSGLLAYYTFNDLINKQGNPMWNGSLSGNASINSTNSSCAFIPDSCAITPVTCAVQAGNDTSVCMGNIMQLNATGAATYNWKPSTGLSNLSVPNPTVTVNSAITYILTGTTGTGCTSTDTVLINVLPNPVILTLNDTTICSGNIIQLNTTGGQQYQWSPAAGLSNNSIANPIALVTANTNYIVTGTALNSCSAKDTININVLPKPVIVASNDTAICRGNIVQLNVTGGQQYQWSPATGLTNNSIANPVAVVVATTSYIVTGTSSNSCSANDTITINVLPNPVVLTLRDTVVCNGDIIQLNATGGQQYQWLPSTGLSSNSIANPVSVITANASYIVTGTGSNGCSAKDTINITVLPKPVITASNDTAICSGNIVKLNATGGQQYQWLPATGLTNNSISNPVALVATNTGYIVTGTASNGCSAKDTVNINVLPKPLVVHSKDTLICLNGSAQLSAAGGISYQWYPLLNLTNANISNPIATPLQSTKYFVTVTGNNNCSAKDSVVINVKPPALFSVKPVTANICSGSSTQLFASGGDTYVWQPINNLSDAAIPNPIAKPDTNTVYNVYIKESYCNSDTTLIVQLKVSPKPEVYITKDGDFNCNKPTVQLNATGGSTYSWTPTAGLSNPNISNPVALTPATTNFYVSVASVNGCLAKDSILVNFTGTGNLQAFQLPTAFTPNRDGLNDCFGIRKWGNVEVKRMEIYNRWGTLIFRGKSYSDCWDGSLNGKPQQSGAFPYIIKVQTACGEVTRKGSVVLIR